MRLILASALDGDGAQEKVRTLLAGKVTRALCIPTAAYCYPLNKREWQTEEIQSIRALGIELELFDITDEIHDNVLKKLNEYDMVYVTGGNSYYLLEKMQKCDFSKAIRLWDTPPKTFLGASAGAVIACPNIAYIGPMDDPTQANLSNFDGLNLYPKPILVHADHPKYGPTAQTILDNFKSKNIPIITLNNDQTLVVDGANEYII